MRSVFTCLFLSIFFLASGQNTFKTRLFPANGLYGYLSKSAQLNDGSLVSVGSLHGDMWIVKTSATGTVLSSKQTGIPGGYSEGYSVIKTSDGGFAVTGVMDNQMKLLKFNADFSLQWKQDYDAGISGSAGLSLVQTADGYLIGGYVSDANGLFAGAFVKTNSTGDPQSQIRYFGFSQGGSSIYTLSPTTDGNYAFLAKVPASGNSNVSYIGKVRPDGTLIWMQQYRDVDLTYQELEGIAGTSDGGVVVTGQGKINGNNRTFYMLMIKLDAGGGLVWSKRLSGNSESGALTVLEDKDGGYLFGGYGGTSSDFHSYGYVVKTTADGALVWKKTFEADPKGYTRFTDLTATSDGGFVATGEGYQSEQGGDYEYAGIIYKFSSSFDACGETAGTADGSLVNFGTTDPDMPAAANSMLSASDEGLLLTDASNQVDNVCSTLPVRLTSFTAVLQGRNVNVNWTTANEVNADYFVVERSADKRSFAALQSVAAKGNSNVTQLYSINDLQPLTGTSYYHLKEVNKDGKTTYSSIVAVTVMSGGTIVISPNPVQNTIHVVMQSVASNNLTLQVVDMKGNMLATQSKVVTVGRNEISIPVSSLAKGVYVLKVTDNKTTQAIRFVKE